MSDKEALQAKYRMARAKAGIARMVLDQFRGELEPKWMEQSTNKVRAAKELEYAKGLIERLEQKYLRQVSRLGKKIGLEPTPRGWRVPVRSVPNDAAHR